MSAVTDTAHEACLCFCANFDCSSLNIYRSEKRFDQTMQREMKHVFHVHYTVSINPAVFEIIKQASCLCLCREDGLTDFNKILCSRSLIVLPAIL
jgi:hypothetical protein